MRAILDIILILLQFASFVVFIYVIFSLLVSFRVLDTRNQVVSTIWRILYQTTEPFLRPIRNFMPKGWQIDFSPFVLILAIIFLQRVIVYYIYPNVI